MTLSVHAVVALGLLSTVGALNTFSQDRVVFYREAASGEGRGAMQRTLGNTVGRLVQRICTGAPQPVGLPHLPRRPQQTGLLHGARHIRPLRHRAAVCSVLLGVLLICLLPVG